METLPIPYTTVTAIAGAYQRANGMIRESCAKILEAQEILKGACVETSCTYDVGYIMRQKHHGFDEPDKIMREVSLAVWRVLVEKMELLKVCSLARAKEIERQLETGEGLPEINEANILATLQSNFNAMQGFFDEAIKEVFDALRPRREGGYKTNHVYDIGPKVIISHGISFSYNTSRTRYMVNHWRDALLRALDNVFHLLDGKGVVKGHYGPLCESINSSPSGYGETEYFRWKGYQNHNLHLEFKRLDLLEKLNLKGGGMNIRPEQTAQAA